MAAPLYEVLVHDHEPPLALAERVFRALTVRLLRCVVEMQMLVGCAHL
jgi:hypothetical protein